MQGLAARALPNLPGDPQAAKGLPQSAEDQVWGLSRKGACMSPGLLCTQRVTASLSRGCWGRGPKCEEPKASQSTASGEKHRDAGEESVKCPGDGPCLGNVLF